MLFQHTESMPFYSNFWHEDSLDSSCSIVHLVEVPTLPHLTLCFWQHDEILARVGGREEVNLRNVFSKAVYAHH